MLRNLRLVLASSFLFGALFSVDAQSYGNLTFVFTQTPHTCYTGTKNVMAVWIQTSTGTFVKTRVRYVGTGTKDHLPAWAVNSGGLASNATAAACNVVGATTGATLTSFGTRTITWDGTDASGNMVPDGTYKITIQSTWDHSSGNTVTTSYTFVKGPNSDIQTPASDANFTNISLQWIPSAAEVTENTTLTNLSVFPNPSNDGMFTMNYSNGKSYSVIDIQGNVIETKELQDAHGIIELDLSAQPNGTYFLRLTGSDEMIETPLVLAK